MNKLLISLLSLTGVAGISTGGYFLLRNGENSEQKVTDGQENSKAAGADVPAAPGGQSDPESGSSDSAAPVPPQPGAKK